MPGYHPVSGKELLFHTEVPASVGLEHVEFFKRSFIKQQINAFPGGHNPFGMLLINPILTTTQSSLGPKFP
jgi:hypothetical protein